MIGKAFTGSSHNRRLEYRDGCPYLVYEVDEKYFGWALEKSGYYSGQAKDNDKNNLNPALGLENGASLEDFAKNFGSYYDPPLVQNNFRDLNFALARVHRRIWFPCKYDREGESKPQDVSDLLVELDHNAFVQSLNSLIGIVRKLNELFYTVEPHPNNYGAYGHEVRNLLLIACMEVENSFSGILSANNYADGRWSTADYIKLKDVLKLDEWSVTFPKYIELGEIYPFAEWDTDRPTQSLIWYEGYNKTKHNREEHFSEATLERVIHSISAAVVLIYAQFGAREEVRNSLLADFVVNVPSSYFETMNYVPHFGRNLSEWTVNDIQL